MIEWHSVREKLPEERVECLIYNSEVDHVIGPIYWVDGIWVDLFATKEAGAAFMPKLKDDDGEGLVTHWALWNGPLR